MRIPPPEAASGESLTYRDKETPWREICISEYVHAKQRVNANARGFGMCVVWLGVCHAGSVIAVSIVMFLYVFRRVGRKCLLARACLPHKRGTRTKMPLGSPYRAASHNHIIKWFCSDRTFRWHIFPLQTKRATPCTICGNERLNLIFSCVIKDKEQLKNSNGQRQGLPTTHIMTKLRCR